MWRVRKGQARIDEFAFILLAGIILIAMLMVAWTTPTEGLAVVEPSSISLQMEPGTFHKIDLKISGRITNVTLSASGEVSNWITFSKTRIDSISNSDMVSVKISVPSNAAFKTYSGDIVVKSTGGERLVPVTISVGVPTLSSRSIPLPDFSISYTPKFKTLDSKEDVIISKGYFSEQILTLTAALDDQELPFVTGGYIRLAIEDTNSLGNLLIYLNGKEIFNSKVREGFLEIPVNKTQIKRFNFIKVYASKPGWQFWATTFYKIRDAKFDVNLQTISTVTFPFSLFDTEIDNFNHFQLVARIKNYSTVQEIQIAVNGQIVFWRPPSIPFLNIIFSRDILDNNLFLNHNNTISFNLEKEGFYDFSNLVLIVHYKSF